MRVTAKLRNRRTLVVFPFPEELPQHFAFEPPNARFSPRYKTGEWDGMISLMQGGYVPTGLFLAQYEQIAEEIPLKWKLIDKRKRCKFRKIPNEAPGIEVRDYQHEAVDAMIQNSNCGGILLNATGTGKTLIAGLLLRRLIGAGVFVVDELTLLDQAREELAAVIGEKVGKIGESEFEPQRITVATIQTLDMHSETEVFQAWARKLRVMFIDELHVALNRRQFDVVAAFRPRAVFGLTATLELDKPEVRLKAFALCGPVIYRYSYEDAIRGKHLTPGIVLGLNMKRELDFTPAVRAEVRAAIRSGTLDDGDKRELYRSRYAACYYSGVVASSKRNDAIEALVREGIARGYMIAVLVERVPHLSNLADRFDDVPHEVVWGGRAVAGRIRAKAAFEAEAVRLLLTNKVFKKGINLKNLNLIIDAAAMKNRNDAVQKFGRGVRLCDGKDGLLYIDVGDVAKEGTINVLAGATTERRDALRKIGVPVFAGRLRADAASILDRGERLLAKHLNALNSSSASS